MEPDDSPSTFFVRMWPSEPASAGEAAWRGSIGRRLALETALFHESRRDVRVHRRAAPPSETSRPRKRSRKRCSDRSSTRALLVCAIVVATSACAKTHGGRVRSLAIAGDGRDRRIAGYGGYVRHDPGAGPSTSPAASEATPTAPRPARPPRDPFRDAAAVAGAKATLTNIAGINGERQIVELARLAVVDPDSGAFEPGRAIERRDFIRWLVKANNALWSDTPDKLGQARGSHRDIRVPGGRVDERPRFCVRAGHARCRITPWGFPTARSGPQRRSRASRCLRSRACSIAVAWISGLQKNIDFARNTALPPWKDKQSISKTYSRCDRHRCRRRRREFYESVRRLVAVPPARRRDARASRRSRGASSAITRSTAARIARLALPPSQPTP